MLMMTNTTSPYSRTCCTTPPATPFHSLKEAAYAPEGVIVLEGVIDSEDDAKAPSPTTRAGPSIQKASGTRLRSVGFRRRGPRSLQF